MEGLDAEGGSDSLFFVGLTKFMEVELEESVVEGTRESEGEGAGKRATHSTQAPLPSSMV
jgi:hypothetical protein